MFNIVGDIAGQYDTLLILLEQMPKGELICLGDPVDRGPKSKETVQYLMENGQTVHSNHAHMMIENFDNTKYYEDGIWFCNGGDATLRSYGKSGVPASHLEFLASCPMYIETDKFVFTHAPLHIQRSLEDAHDIGTGFLKEFDIASEISVLWNRYVPERPHPKLNGKINVFGHNSSYNTKVYCKQFARGIHLTPEDFSKFPKEDVWAIGIDTSGAKKLTGMHITKDGTMSLFEQDYI